MTTVGVWSLGLVLCLAGATLLWRNLAGSPIPLDVAAYWGVVPLLLGLELLLARQRAAIRARQTGEPVRIRLHPGAIAGLAVVLAVAVVANMATAFAGTGWWHWTRGPFGDITHPYEATAVVEGRAEVGTGAREVVIEALPGRWTITGTEGPDVLVTCDLTARARTSELATAAAGGAKVEMVEAGGTVTVTFAVPGYDSSRTRQDVSPSAEGTIAVPRGLALRVEQPAGGVSLHDIDGDVEVKLAAGNLDLFDLGGSADGSVAAGNVTARRVAGDLTVSVATGRVDIDDPGASVDVTVAAGNCAVRSALSLAGDWAVTVATGNIEVRFPRASSIVVSAETYGSVSSNLGFSLSTSAGRNILSGTLGAGEHHLDLETRAGNIVLVGTDG